MLWGCFFVRGPLNESNKRTPVVPSVVAHLSAAIIAYHENQFGSSPQMTNTAISVQLLQRLSKLDRWIPFPVHWQIAISPLLGDCVFQTVSAPTVRLGPSKEIPLTSLTEAICPAHNKNTGSSDQEPLDTHWCGGRFNQSWTSPESVYEVGKRHITNYDSGAGSCSAS